MTDQNKASEPLTPEQALAGYGVLVRPFQGDSMLPFLREKTDAVKLIPPPAELKQYDLPLYRRPSGQLVMHRIIAVRKNYYLICGDNRRCYEKVPREWIIALAVGRYRGDEYLDFEDAQYCAQVRALCHKRDGFWGCVKHYGRAICHIPYRIMRRTKKRST